MAEGRNRIFGGKVLLVVGVVLVAIVLASRWWRVTYGGTNAFWELHRGVVGLNVFASANPFHRGFECSSIDPRWTRLELWLNNPDCEVSAGVFEYSVQRFPGRGTQSYIGVLLWPHALLAFLAGVILLRKEIAALVRREDAPNTCPACGYSRAGLAEAAPCPECGGVVKSEGEA